MFSPVRNMIKYTYVLIIAILAGLIIAAFPLYSSNISQAIFPNTHYDSYRKGEHIKDHENTSINSIPKSDLNNDEVDAILYIREEEKLARDVYLTLYEKWNLPIFKNIASSEQIHMDAVKQLIDRYGLKDSVVGEIGKFTNPELQELYNKLVNKGSKSLEEALQVGASIEEVDIVDIKKYLSKVDNQDIQFIFNNLIKGSQNHLRSFVSTMKKYGITYSPQYLSQEEFNRIISIHIETGQKGASHDKRG